MSLKKEISLSAESFKGNPFDTIFFGGGTPSILSSFQIEDVLNHLHKNFRISNDTEITLESNPEDFFEKNSADYRSAGINRLSLGVQSFLNSELKFLTRQHTSEEAVDVIKEAAKHFDNINLDIIYSLPDQTKTDLDLSLSKAIELDVKHISAYTLTYEEKTVLFKSLQKNLIKKNPENVEAELYNFVSEKLISNGYGHYEVSNFSKEDFKCRHNLKYWKYENYIGFGPSAHSFFNEVRWNNFRDIVKYNSFTEKNTLPVEDRYEVTSEQKHLEFIMLSLRSGGIDFTKYFELFNEDFGKKFISSVNELVENEYALIDDKRFRLNEKGYTLADEIIAKYF